MSRWGRAAEAALLLAAVAEVFATRSLGPSWVFAGAFVVVCALTLRRRFPRTVLGLALLALSTGYLWIPALGALHTLAVTRRRLAEVITGSVAVAVVAFVPWRLFDSEPVSLPEATLGVLTALMLASAPASLGLLGRSRAELAQRVGELALAREREGRLAAEQAVLRERERLARDMHDTAAHHLSLISLQAAALAAVADCPDYREAAEELGGLSRHAAADLRRTIRQLGADRDESGPGLADLRVLIRAAGDTVRAELDAVDPAECSPEVQHTAYRVVQEALANVRRHAPGAPVEVEVRRTAAGLLVGVRNGPAGEGPPGGPADPGGSGLAGLRDRVAAVGGTLRAGAEPEGGHVVRAEIPLRSRGGAG
ncbi:sensor histidine kinase [Streptomyces sp. SYSU K217416]